MTSAARLLAGAVAAVLCVTLAQEGQAGDSVWTSGGPYGGTVNAIVIDPHDPTIVYASFTGAYEAVFKSTDRGSSWAPAGSLNTRQGGNGYALALDPLTPSTVYAGTDAGTFKSTDSGTNWMPSNSISSIALAIDPVTPSTMYAGADNGGFVKSTDAGGHWFGTGEDQMSYFHPVTVDPRTPTTLYRGLLENSLWAPPWGRIQKSTNSGENWQTIAESYNASCSAILVDPQHAATVYAAFSSGTIKSTDAGATWSTLDVPTVYALAFDPSDPSTLYAGNGSGVLKSTDSGTTWAPRSNGIDGLIITAIAVDPQMPSIVFAGSEYQGVFRSTDSGATWQATNIGLTNIGITQLAMELSMPSTVYAGTFRNGIFRTTDSGGAWVAVNAGLPSLAVKSVAIGSPDSSIVYAGLYGNGLFRSTDGGGSWAPLNGGFIGDASAIAIDPSTPSTLYAGEYQLFKSTDAGLTWHQTLRIGGYYAAFLALDPRAPGTIFVLDNGGELFRSTDAGGSWSGSLTEDLRYRYPENGLAIDPIDTSTLYVPTSDGLFRSTDSGTSWNSASATLPAVPISFLIDPSRPTFWYAGTPDGVFRSPDAGLSWLKINRRLEVSVLALDPTGDVTLYAGLKYGSVWQITRPTPPRTGFYPVKPCRALDTRNAASGGPSISAGAQRLVRLAYMCGIPPDAVSLGGNVTVVNPASSGGLRLYAALQPKPDGSTIYFSTGRTRSNNGAFGVTDASGSWSQLGITNDSADPVDVLLDVIGYFK